MRILVACDTWKAPIFRQHLTAAKVPWVDAPKDGLPPGTAGLLVEGTDPRFIAIIAAAANREAEVTQRGSPDAN